MEEIRIVDTTLRDGDISLWAYGMTTGMMLPALRHMDEAGFDSMEFFLSLRGAHLSDEELLLRFYAGPEFVDALNAAPPRKEYLSRG
jgi:hypothetical protein